MATTMSNEAISPNRTSILPVPRPSLRSIAIFLLILIVLLTILGFVMYWASLIVERSDRSEVADIIFPYSISLHSEMTRRLGRVAGIAAFMKSHQTNPEYEAIFQPFAAGLFDKDMGIRNFQIVEGTTTTHVYPLEDNSQMIGMDWLKVTSGKNLRVLKEAIASKQPTVIGPFEAHKDEWVVAAIEPVKNANGSLYGLATAMYDYQPVIKSIRLDRAGIKLDLAIRTSDGAMAYGKPSVFKSNPVVKKVKVGDMYWEMAATPKGGWAAQRNKRLLPMILSGIVIVVLAAVLLAIGIDVNRYLSVAVGARTKDLNSSNMELSNINRLYRTLSSINEKIVRAADKKTLLKDICEVLVEKGSFRMSWIGLVDARTKHVAVAASAGDVAGYLEGLKIIVPDKSSGHGPKAKALLAHKAFVCNDIETDPDMAPWRDLSREHGFKSQASFPLLSGETLIGSLNVYSGEPGVYSEEEVRLLTEVSEDIGFAIDAMDKESAKRAAEQALEHAATFPMNNPNPVIEFDTNGKVAFANDAARNALVAIGVKEDLKIFLPDDYKKILQMMKTVNPPATVSREVAIGEKVFGETVHLAGQFGTIRVYATDITDKLKNEAILEQNQKELARSYDIIKRSLEGTVQAIASVAEHKDPYTAGHERRVVDLSIAIGKEMDLDEAVLEGLKIAATLHDVGKIYIPAEILSKPGKLNDLEFSMIKAHPRYSHEVLGNIDFPWPIADIALQHHERIDGSGYPNGLKGKDILIEAKILAVADVIEAMASHRPYRPALPLKEAMEEVSKGAGKIYDQKVVDATLKIFKEGYKL
jgi:sensor domain CHASE-containing protein